MTKRPRTGEGCDPGNSGVWEGDYGWGVRVHRVCVFITAGPITKLFAGGGGGEWTSPFGARGKSSVRYGTRLGDLKNKQSTERESLMLRG